MYALIFFCLFFLIPQDGILSKARKQRCEVNDDCLETECCLYGFWSSNHCEKFEEEGGRCNPTLVKDETHKFYRSMCPCKEGLECMNEETIKSRGKITHYNPKCRDPKTHTPGPVIEITPKETDERK